jgi:hypothetical protein
MSREETPVLSGSLPAFEMFMTSWEMLGEKHPRLAPFIDIGLKWASKYYCRMDQTRAYVIAMGMFLFMLCYYVLIVLQFSIRLCACHGFENTGNLIILKRPSVLSKKRFVLLSVLVLS